MTGKDILLFDLDGTLTDPAVGITRSVQHALRAFGIQVDNPTELYGFIGPPLTESFIRFFEFTREQAVRAVGVYREYFADTGIYENAIYPGIPSLLADLRQEGKQLILATSKPTVFARRILEYFQLTPYITYISGSFLDGRRTDKAEVIHHGLEQAGAADLSRAVMVGDREYDVYGAKQAGIPCIGVSYGYGSRRELEDAGALLVVDTVEELRERLLGGGGK